MSVEAILNEFGLKLVKDIKSNLQEKQKEKSSKYGTPYNPNSNLVASVDMNITIKANSYMFELKMADYFDIVDRGRRAGAVSKEGQKSISNWIKRKGIDVKSIISDMREKAKLKNPPKTTRKRKTKKLTYEVARKQFTYLVSRKVKMDGFLGNHFYSEIILDGRLEKLQKDIQDDLNNDIEIIIKDFKQ
jgi:hypothetical protein